MKILIDGDGCPKIERIVSKAKTEEISVIIFCDTFRIITSDYAKVVTVGKGKDAVDFEILKHCKKGDIVVTKDYQYNAIAFVA